MDGQVDGVQCLMKPLREGHILSNNNHDACVLKVHNDPSRSFNILAPIESVYDPLNSNLGPILPSFREIRAFVC